MTPILTSCAKGTAAMMAPAWRETRPAGPQRRRGRANGTARVPQAALLKDCPATSSSSLLLCHLPPKFRINTTLRQKVCAKSRSGGAGHTVLSHGTTRLAL